MQLPIVAPAPGDCSCGRLPDLFENRCQFQHFQNYLTGLIVLDNKSLTNITRCVLESADKRTCPASSLKRPGFKSRSTIVASRISSSRRKGSQSEG